MSKLFILSIASGYGGAERSIEIILRHLPTDVAVRVYAESAIHLEQLSRPGVLPAAARVVQTAPTETVWGRRRAALRLAFDYLHHQPAAVLINTHASALVAAMAARVVPDLGRRCHLYVRDFLWRDLDFIFERLTGAQVLLPSAVVAERSGYLSPFHLEPFGPVPCSIVPDMVELAVGTVTFEGPVLHLATVNPYKGHTDLMMALHRLKSRGTAINVRSAGVVGDVALHARLHRLIHSLHIDDCYVLDGYVPNPGPMLRECRAVVVPSVSHSGGPETFGRTVIEAWAYRKPVVAYASGAIARLVEDGVDGFLVPEGDIDALGRALYQLSASTELCRRLGEAGHAKVVRHYEAGAVTRQLLASLAPLEVTGG